MFVHRLNDWIRIFFVVYILLLVIPAKISLARSLSVNQKINKIIALIKSRNGSMKAVQDLHGSAKSKEGASAYFPDPVLKVNVFGAPIETRNGPQNFNIVLNQGIKWPSVLEAEQKYAASLVMQERYGLEEFDLKLIYKAKALIYEYSQLASKLENKKKIIITLTKLNKVALNRLKLGSTSQAELTRINIEVVKANQQKKAIQSKMLAIRQKLRAMAGGLDVSHLLPTNIDSRWGSVRSLDPFKIDLSHHPLLKKGQAKVNHALARVAQVKARRLPKLGVSLSYFQIGESKAAMPSSETGKDAWAVGASITLPVWRGKYDSIESAQILEESAKSHSLKQQELDLRASISSTYEELKSVKAISSMFKNDILPQANQTFKSDQDSYAQGQTDFDKVIGNYIRVIRFENQWIDSLLKQALLKAQLERLVAAKL